MFDVLDPSDNQYKNRFHLASIVGLLGPPPLDFLQKSAFSAVYFDEKGRCSPQFRVDKANISWQGNGNV